MSLAKLHRVTLVTFLLGLAATGNGLLSYGAPAAEAPPPPGQEPKPAHTRPHFDNALGWNWQVAPMEHQAGGSWATAGVVAMPEKDREGALVLSLAHAWEPGPDGAKYRPVAFDAAGKRYLLPVQFGGASGGVKASVALYRYRLDPKVLPADQVRFLGVEVLTPEGRKVVAADAARRAREAGVEVLPTPEVGAPYDFTLTAMNGKKIRAADLRGQVVLIDCWATWCSPCMAKMPALKALYEKHQKDGFAIVGVSFDRDEAVAKKALGKLGLTWPQVLVPSNEKAGELWQEVSDIESLPRLFLLDRQGILRADCGPGSLEEEVVKLLKEKPAEKARP